MDEREGEVTLTLKAKMRMLSQEYLHNVQHGADGLKEVMRPKYIFRSL